MRRRGSVLVRSGFRPRPPAPSDGTRQPHRHRQRPGASEPILLGDAGARGTKLHAASRNRAAMPEAVPRLRCEKSEHSFPVGFDFNPRRARQDWLQWEESRQRPIRAITGGKILHRFAVRQVQTAPAGDENFPPRRRLCVAEQHARAVQSRDLSRPQSSRTGADDHDISCFGDAWLHRSFPLSAR